MGYFPFFTDISGRRCLVVGGGRIALGKLEKLMGFGAEITVIAESICSGISEFPEIKCISRAFAESDIESADFVIAATGDHVLNSRIAGLCRARGIPVNSVDDIENCDFIFPSLIQRGDVTIAISTGGSCPAFAKYLREVIESAVGESCGAIAELLGRYRPVIKEMFDSGEKRRRAHEAIIKMCTESREELPGDEEINKLLENLYEAENRNAPQQTCNCADNAGGGSDKPDFSGYRNGNSPHNDEGRRCY